MDTTYLDDYEEASALSESRPRPTPGAYLLRLPTTITHESINWGGREGLRFHIGGATIAEGEFEGTTIGRFVSVANIPRGTTQKFSDAADLLKNFGITPQSTWTEEDWINAMNAIAGEVTPHPVYLTYQGSYKNGSDKRTYLKAKDFSDGDGGYVRCLYLEDGVLTKDEPTGFETLSKDEKRKIQVWANLEPGFRGLAPRPSK